MNQTATSFGADNETSGPPIPMIPIASHSIATSCAADCTAADAATSNDPAVSDRRSPIRSMIRPAGGAVTMYSSAHAPSANPSVLRLMSSSARTCVTIGGIASRIIPNAT